eukprot:CAMPEP_0172181086 /NCGR_PEP_ID=MMETSP1050-20130122/17619_1 /TAXON_ID=233186 /ORGANISM="Cryptomonas curvata, Strain CCAP979/52" /LENGTH=191 /DNA_ID=CAMNT_0012854323 /DNA_START=364 /DNA_END=939 /DNA_ORIENTATION=+
MTKEQIYSEVEKAFKEHIPPAPHWSEIEKQFEEFQSQSKKERFELQQKKVQEEVLRRLPKLDALGRAYSTGRRKTSVARVWVTKGTGTVIVNRVHMMDYFQRMALREEIFQPLQVTGQPMSYNVWCTVKGGGLSGQAGAIKLGVAKALQAMDPSYRSELKKCKLLTYDTRQVERKKPGRMKARRRFQWVKR